MILTLHAVSKSYMRKGERISALRDISLDLAAGDFMGIFGPSGSGKTTLLRLLAGLERPDRGLVAYQGQRLDLMSKAERSQYLRRTIGCIWADQRLETGFDVLQTVALPLLLDGSDKREAKRKARECLIAVGAEHCEMAEAEELSQGERQRVAIAQAIVCEPRLILGDEPASNLDMEERDAILCMLQNQAEQHRMAILITDSDPLALMRTSPLLYIKRGELQNADHLRTAPLAEVIPLRDQDVADRPKHA